MDFILKTFVSSFYKSLSYLQKLFVGSVKVESPGVLAGDVSIIEPTTIISKVLPFVLIPVAILFVLVALVVTILVIKSKNKDIKK